MDTISPTFYAVIGMLIITNIGAIGAMVVFIFKAGHFVAETKYGINDAKERANRAHQRLDKMERFQGEV